jgi:hypothetical protein
MAENSATQPPVATRPPERAIPSRWAVGLTAFAACVMILLGLFQMMAGFVALFDNSLYVMSPHYFFELNLGAWGLIHLLLGILIVAAGIGLFTGQVWARVVGVVLALLSAIANFASIPHYPIWSLTIISFAIGVVWALTAHGEDIITA